MKNILLIGYGKMGKIHKRVIDSNTNSKLYGIVESNPNNIDYIDKNLIYFKDVSETKKHLDQIDAAIVATNTFTHYKIGKFLLDNRIPTLIEKPISTNLFEIIKLINFAINENIILRCGLLELYNPIFKYLENLKIQKIKNIQIFRHSEKITNRHLDNIIFDLLIHDLSVLFNLFKNSNFEIRAKNVNSKEKNPESVDVFVKINNIPILISVSREAQEKLRKWSIKTQDSSYELDLVRKEIKILQKGEIKIENNAILSTNVNRHIKSFSNVPEPAQIQLENLLKNIDNLNVDKQHLDLVLNTHTEVNNIYNIS